MYSERTGIVSTIKKIAESEAKKINVADLAIVTAVYPHSSSSDEYNYECDVKLKDKDDMDHKRVPVATQHIGLANIPHVNDLVLITYLNGDINSPIIIGRLYNDKDRPPENKEEEVIYKPPYSKNSDLRRIYIELPEQSVKIRLADNGIFIDTDYEIQIHSKGKTAIECDSELSLKAASIKIESDSELSLKGANVKIDATANMEIISSGPLALKGVTVKNEATGTMDVTALGPLTVKGVIVKIN